ncbi:hypothetical protein ACOMHN_051489 [Nucella lapillus]
MKRLRCAEIEQGAASLRGKLKEDFDRLVDKHRREDNAPSSDTAGTGKDNFDRLVHKHRREDNDSSSDTADTEKEDLCVSYEREKLRLIQHYESQMLSLQQEVSALQQHFEAERTAFQQLQSGKLVQSIRQELQEEAGGRGGPLNHSWEEARRELMVQNQLLEEELTDLKGALVQERQRAAEAHALRETVRCLRAENKEAQCIAESLKEKMSRLHQQQDLERANFERHIDDLERDKEKALRVQALHLAGATQQGMGRAEAQREILRQVLQQVETMHASSPHGQPPLQEECELLKQSNGHLEEMVRVLRQRSDKELLEREREYQDHVHDLWVEKKRLQNMLQRTTDKVSLLETQRHAISLQEALTQRTQLADRIMAETEKEQRQERERWEDQKKKTQTQLEASTEMYLNLALQHKALRQSADAADDVDIVRCVSASVQLTQQMMLILYVVFQRQCSSRLTQQMMLILYVVFQRQCSSRLTQQMQQLYRENADLLTVLQQTETRHSAAQRRDATLTQQCHAWHTAVQRLLCQGGEEEE